MDEYEFVCTLTTFSTCLARHVWQLLVYIGSYLKLMVDKRVYKYGSEANCHLLQSIVLCHPSRFTPQDNLSCPHIFLFIDFLRSFIMISYCILYVLRISPAAWQHTYIYILFAFVIGFGRRYSQGRMDIYIIYESKLNLCNKIV